MLAIFTSTYITIQAIKTATAVRINGIVIQKPRITPFGFVQYRFALDERGHLIVLSKDTLNTV